MSTDGHEENGMTVENRVAITGIVNRLTPEFEGVFAPETLQRWVEESWSHLAASASIDAFMPVLSERFARERLRARARSQGITDSGVPEVLFVCVHNAGRSQMAAALLTWRGEGRVHVRSAGSEPASEINPAVAAALDELGLDSSQEFPKPLTDEFVQAADVVITMGCGDACPIYPGKRYLDWELDDPAGKTLEDVRPIRDEIDRRVRGLLDELTAADERDRSAAC
jgi:protein-tyrosine-phosphatase